MNFRLVENRKRRGRRRTGSVVAEALVAGAGPWMPGRSDLNR